MALQSPINIPIGGLSTSPSDYLCDDGSLAAAINVVHEDGSLHPFHASAPSIVAALNDFSVIIQHHNQDYRHLILRDKDSFVCWFDLPAPVPEASASGSTVPSVTPDNVHYLPDLSTNTNLSGVIRAEVMGNMLILYTSSNVHYFLFRPAEGNYRALGNNLPEINLQFGLQSQFHINEKEFDDTIDIAYEGNDYRPDIKKFFLTDDAVFNPIDKSRIKEATQGAIAKFIKTMNDRGRFVMPFLVRYGYHLKTSSSVVSNLSAPILMVPSTIAPIVDLAKWSVREDYFKMAYSVSGVSSALYYQIINSEVKRQLEDWSDIIDSVAIYISAPIYTYDADSDIVRLSWVNEKTGNFTNEGFSDHTLVYDPSKAKLPLRDSLKSSVIIGGLRKFTEGRVEDSDFIFDTNTTDTLIYGEDICRLNNIAGSSDIDFAKQSGFIREASNGTLGLGTDDSNGILNDYWFNFSDGDKYDHAEINDKFRQHLSMFCLLPERYADSKVLEDVYNTSTFFLLDTIKINKIDSEPHIIRKDAGYIHNIVAHQKLQNDDFNSRAIRIPHVTSVYNNRLNIADFTEIIPDAVSAGSGTQVCSPEGILDTAAMSFQHVTYYHISSINHDYWVKQVEDDVALSHIPYLFFFYCNNPDVTEVETYYYNPSVCYHCHLDLQQHRSLNGSYWVSRTMQGTDISRLFTVTTNPPHDFFFTFVESGKNISPEQSIVNTHHNLILTSEVASPFTFLASNSAEVGSGSILAMVPITTALSQGQFGAYPMYCFTTEGVWALKPNDTGGWASAAPVSRDVVLTNPDTGDAAILQLDQSIIFATDRGLMQITGSSIDCITEVFNGDNDIFATLYQSHVKNILSALTDINESSFFSATAVTFRQFCSNSIFTYDYANQRIIIGNPAFNCIYIFSMKDKQWTTAPLTITKAVNSYPQSFAVASGEHYIPIYNEGQEAPVPDASASVPCNYLIDFSNAVTITDPDILHAATTGYILTRPLKFDAPDILKTIRQIDIRGTFHEESRISSKPILNKEHHHLAIILYGTNDNSLQHWSKVASCYGARLSCRTGSPFKFYRIAIISHLQPGESINSIQVLFETREDAKIQ